MNPVEQIISGEEWLEISRQLEQHHALFYQLWQLGKPLFDPRIPTAEVRFNREGDCIEFVFNPDFWKKLSVYERLFVICHECLHVIFNHGLRGRDTKEADRANIAMDIVVNHTLARGFNFDRSQLSLDKEMCWVDTIFPGRQDIPDDQSFEYYFKIIPKTNLSSLDNHGSLPGGGDWGDIVKKLDENLTPEQKEAIKDILEQHTEGDTPGGQLAGKGALGIWSFVKFNPAKRKKKWETVIKQWSKKFLKDDNKEIEQWVRLNRRLSFFGNSSVFLPSEMENETLTEDRIRVWFFQDCSGSCWHLKDRFFQAARSLPPERFDVKLHTFDDRIYPADINKNMVWGGGGTSFSIIENYIQQQMKDNNEDYPEAVFIISDGYGTRVQPEQPKKWYWFLSVRDFYYIKHYIPDACNRYYLADFE